MKSGFVKKSNIHKHCDKSADHQQTEENLKEFMYMRMAKGKKNEIFDLINRSKWTKDTKASDIETSEIQFSYKHNKTSINITLSKINLLIFMGALNTQLLVQIILKKIQLRKELFLLEIEQ